MLGLGYKTKKTMQKILVANRGEIALRVMKTAKKMGIRTVGVYSEADRDAPHVLFADESICLGPAPSTESYLNIEKIITAALETGTDAIHPGYGFLSENAAFARRVSEAGITFIGPSPEAIEIMGSKLAAKEAVAKYQIPLVPGTEEAISDLGSAKVRALEIGYPILVKASAGGGGKGMRIIHSEKDFEDQMNRAISEARAAFGDGAVFIEKYVSSPRHIEFQILADKHGKVLHLFERECSIQRRHQKVVEEAPSVVLTPERREAMGRDAVKVALACNYTGAGTVEFLLDEQLNYYFLEMNTRLQVEHPVTELITGIDLVEQQIRIARGEQLKFDQKDLEIKGHAIELRIYAEDPSNDFLPSVGTLETYIAPEGPGIRLDDGYRKGMQIPIYYDPMIAKLIAYGIDRQEAIGRLQQAIMDYKIEGLATTLPFGAFVLKHPSFLGGNFDTHFVQHHFSPAKLEEDAEQTRRIAAIGGLYWWLRQKNNLENLPSSNDGWWKQRK